MPYENIQYFAHFCKDTIFLVVTVDPVEVCEVLIVESCTRTFLPNPHAVEVSLVRMLIHTGAILSFTTNHEVFPEMMLAKILVTF